MKRLRRWFAEWFQEMKKENWPEGIRLNLFGGSIRETIGYLKSRNERR